MGQMYNISKSKSALTTEWLADLDHQLQLGDLAEFTRRKYQWGVGQFLDWADAQEIDLVNNQVVRRWIAYLQESGQNSNTIGVWTAGLMNFL